MAEYVVRIPADKLDASGPNGPGPSEMSYGEDETEARRMARLTGGTLVIIGECECSEEYGPCEQHGTVLAQREGAHSRTADELTYVYVLDCFAILGQEPTPVAADVLQRVEADWEAQENTHGVYWVSDPDLADELRDLAWQLESTIGAWTFWDDGYVIVEPTEDCPLR